MKAGQNAVGRTELLAPAGNPEAFYGAVRTGADAVYLAGNRFGARAYADNFTGEELIKCIRYGHLFGKKIYLTVNTLLKERETEELYEYLLPFYEEGLDGVIVQDPGVLRLVRNDFPGLKIHVSTQMTLCSGYGVRLLKDMGASRIVPARELSLEEICLLKREAETEIECFIHGAMCYCYSGQCLFSSILGGRSGNRGRCAQPCRLPYTVETGGKRLKDCYVLSLKDMCTIEHLPRLMEAGIDSFKIEGRMKKPEYAAGVTQVYRRYMDAYYELREKHGAEEAAQSWHVESRDRKILHSLYIRSQVQDGYYFRRNGREMITLDSPAYNAGDEALLAEIREKYLKAPLKLPVVLEAEFRAGEPARVTAALTEKEKIPIVCTVTGDPAGRALKQPVTEENLSLRLGKLGDSPFYPRQIKVILEDNCFYPLGQVNELRRAAVRVLEEKILTERGYGEGFREKSAPRKLTDRNSQCAETVKKRKKTGGDVISLRTGEQLQAVWEWLEENPDRKISRIYVEADLLLQEREGISKVCEAISRRVFSGASGEIPGRRGFFISLPYILREPEETYLDRICSEAEESGLTWGFLVRSMDGLGYLEERYRHREKRPVCRGDAGCYVWNRAGAEELLPYLAGFCLPWELNAKEQRHLAESFPEKEVSFEKIVYGRIPMMVTANCIRRTAGLCGGKRGKMIPGKLPAGSGRQDTFLTDRYHKKFPVVENCIHCMNIIYNSVPLSLYRELSLWRERTDLRMDFILEGSGEVKRLLDAFLKGMPLPPGDYTAGHEKRGVE